MVDLDCFQQRNVQWHRPSVIDRIHSLQHIVAVDVLRTNDQQLLLEHMK